MSIGHGMLFATVQVHKNSQAGRAPLANRQEDDRVKMETSVVGANWQTAGVDIRECISLSRDATRELLNAFKIENVFREALILNTCNRTEIYFVSRKHPHEDALAYMLKGRGMSQQEPRIGKGD